MKERERASRIWKSTCRLRFLLPPPFLQTCFIGIASYFLLFLKHPNKYLFLTYINIFDFFYSHYYTIINILFFIYNIITALEIKTPSYDYIVYIPAKLGFVIQSLTILYSDSSIISSRWFELLHVWLFVVLLLYTYITIAFTSAPDAKLHVFTLGKYFKGRRACIAYIGSTCSFDFYYYSLL